MPRILACTAGPDDWKQFLADPDKHWKSGYSAKAVALSWEAADGLPEEVARALDSAPGNVLSHAVPFLAVPEYRTDLPGGDRPSQTDVMVIGRAEGGAFAMAVEGKVAESFGPTIGDWRNEASDGKQVRWSYLCATLGLDETLSPALRYQLFHRAASAVLAARRYHAPLAVLLVQSFSPNDVGYADFKIFVELFGKGPALGSVVEIATLGKTRLFAGWARGDARFVATS
jgi:hypothetical protein